jgi:voltage-dependent anion channel protein 2
MQVGAEAVRKISSGDTTISLGYSKVLPSGALGKFKIDNTGVLAALYETKLTSGEKVAGAIQLQATDLSKPVKYGFALDLN